MTNIINKIQNNVSLAPFTTYKIGGVAKFFIEPETDEELLEALAWAKGNNEKIIILGGGSNVLINDKDIDAVVIRAANRQIEVRGDRIVCGAAANLVAVSRSATANNLSGLEWATGIPGATIGGSIRGNAGAFGKNMADIVETVSVLAIDKKKFFTFSNNDCQFGYRTSIFKNNNYFIWSATLHLQPDKKENIEEKTLNSLNHRLKNNPRLPSAGSVFKNISFQTIREANPNLANRLIAMGHDETKDVGAGLLIDLAGLKGKKIGEAKISLEHGNFIVNTGRATADDIASLISFAKEKIRNNFSIQLHEEIEYLGFD